MSLFSIFEPQAILSLPANWLTCGLLLAMPSAVWAAKSTSMVFLKNLIFFVTNEFKAVSKPFTPGSNMIQGISLFVLILGINFLGLLPYVMPSSGHLPFAITLALPLWVGHTAYSWGRQPNVMFAHLVPSGSPGGLMPFMVIIELVSSLIRPLTLSVRLVANIVAGHLLLTLLSSAATPHSGYVVYLIVLMSLVLLSTLETAVATIQAYVFSVLSTLYLAEVDSFDMNN